MKKILLALTALAALLQVTSCSKELDNPSADGPKVKATFTVQLPNGVDTKAAISDGLTATELKFYAYDKNNKHLELDQTVTVSGRTASITAELVKGIKYQFVFWAQKPGQYTSGIDAATGTLTISPADMMNSDAWDAFYWHEPLAEVTGSFTKNIVLKRPFAQINVGAPVTLNDATPPARTGGDFYAAAKSGLAIDATLTTAYTVKAYTKMNLLDGAVSGMEDTPVAMTAVAHPDEFLTVSDTRFDYAAMAYVLAPAADGTTVDLVLKLNTKQNGADVELTRSVPNVPIRRNYRTNILGRIFTVDGNFNITVDQNFYHEAYDDSNVPDYFPEANSIDAANALFADKINGVTLKMDEGVSGTLTLPNVSDDVYLNILGDFTDDKITIEYGGDAHPASLYIYAPQLFELSGNLADTHVVINPYSHIDQGTLYVSNGTLVIKPKAYYGRLVMMQGSLLVEAEAKIDTARIDKSVKILDADKPLDERAKVAIEEDATVIKLVIEDLSGNATIKGKVDSVSVSRTAEPGETAADTPKVDIAGTATVETVEQKDDAGITIAGDAKVEEVIADNPSKVDGEGASNVEFLIMNEAMLTDAVEAQLAKMKIGDNFTITRGYTIDFSTDLNLNHYTISADATNTSAFPNSRAFKFAGTEAINIKIHGGEIKLLDNNIYGPFRMDNSNADIVLDSLTLNNKMAYGLGIKIVKAKSLALSNSTINSVIGGCIEQGTNCPLTITNCTFNQTELDTDHPWISAGVAVSYGGELTVESGNFSAYRTLYLYSSGGTINVSGGSFEGRDAVISVDNNNWEPGYAGGSFINISDGSFDGPIFVSGWGAATPAPVAALNISGGTFTNSTNNTMFHASNGTISITGGSFSENPSAYVAYGYEAVYNEQTNYWNVQEKKVVWNQTTDVYYPELAPALTAAANNDSLVVLRNCAVVSHIDLTKSVKLNLNGKTITNEVSSARMIDLNNSSITLKVYNGKLYTNPTNTPNSYGFFRLQNSGQNLILKNVDMEGATNAAALLRFNQYFQTIEVSDCSITMLDNPYRQALVAKNGSGNTLKMTNVEIVNNSTCVQDYSVVSMEGQNCEFTNVSYSGEKCPTGFYTGNATFTDCSIQTQSEGSLNISPSYPWLASTLATSLGQAMTVNSGSYEGYYCVYLFSSGGTINIEGGSFVGTNTAVYVDNNTWEPGYAASSVINISGGSFDGPIRVNGWGKADPAPVAALNISGGTFTNSTNYTMFNASNGTISITGGSFSEDPSAYVADGYEATQEGDVWTVSAIEI